MTAALTFPPLFGFALIVMPDPLIEVQARRHPRKKRRLQKKWRKRYGTIRIVDPSFDPYRVHLDESRGTIYCSARGKAAILANLRTGQNE